MIEKRFTQKDEDDWEIFENGEHFAFAHSGYNAKKIIERLNELYDKLDCHILLTDQERQKVSNFIKGIEKENEQLKSEIEKLSYANEDLLKEKREWKKLSDEYAKIYDENKKLKQQYSVLEITLMNNQLAYNDLEEENKQLKKENKELRQDNDIKFWKHQFMMTYNTSQIIMHEISRAIDGGYEISEEFQKYLNELRVQNDKNKEKMERLRI